MHRAGLPWRDALTLPLGEALDIAEDRLDQDALEKHRHDVRTWASLAPYSAEKQPEPPELD
jgi:hypothetical protein